ncbi:MAG: hypothetical protein DRH76_10265, partial [Deltaproteobacteria bacterium]
MVRDGEVTGSVVEAVAEGSDPVVFDELVAPDSGRATIEISSETLQRTTEVRVLNGFLTVLPPLLAILLAVIFRQVIVALLAGIWLGAFLVNGFEPFTAVLRTLDHYVLSALTDSSHASIIIFSMLLGGMVALMSRSGGTRGIVDSLQGWASSRRST